MLKKLKKKNNIYNFYFAHYVYVWMEEFIEQDIPVGYITIESKILL